MNTPIQTPKKSFKSDTLVNIPASPFLKHLGYGTGVAVYKFNRSPKTNSLSSPWAVKMIKNTKHKTITNRLRTEAKILRKMNNPYIVGFRQFSVNQDGKECLAMEECTISLGDLIQTRRDDDELAFPVDKILKVGLDISKALDYLHTEMLLLHGDIKSFNVLIKGDFDICKLCDFGVCVRLKKNGELDTDKVPEDLEYDGTDCWAAPEVLIYPPKITNKADIFSLGLVLWETMALEVPHAGFNESDDSIELDESAIRESFGTRPAVPFDMFPKIEEYYPAIEIFYCCTVSEPNERPSANILTLAITDMINGKENKPQNDQ